MTQRTLGLLMPMPKAIGGADDPRVVAQERSWFGERSSRGEARVVGARREAAAGERFGDALGGGAAGAVDDAALVLARPDELQDLLQRLVLRHDAVGEIGAVEARDEHRRIAQLAGAVTMSARDALGRGGGQRHDRHVREAAAQPRELAVFRTEIVAPLGDAVRLVDRDGT